MKGGRGVWISRSRSGGDVQEHVLPQARHQHASDEFLPACSKHLFCAQHMHGAGSLANGSPPTPLASSVAIRAPASPILPCDPAAYVPLTSKRGRESGFCQSTSFRLLQFQFLLLSTNSLFSPSPSSHSHNNKKSSFFLTIDAEGSRCALAQPGGAGTCAGDAAVDGERGCETASRPGALE